MSTYVAFLLVGLGTGAVYAALALGLVVVHKGTGVINFAQGAIAVWAAYVYAEVRRSGDLVLPVGRVHVGDEFVVALVVGLVSVAAIGLSAHWFVFRPLRAAPPLAKVVASVGLMLTLQALVVLRFGSTPRTVAPILPNEVVQWGSVSVPRDRLFLAAIAGLLALGLWALFRFTRIGLAVRAASENEIAAALTGYSPTFLAGFTWVLSATVTGTMVILAAPATNLDPNRYTLLVVPALAVALVGRLHSLGVVSVAGLALGAFQSEITFLGSRAWWPEWAVAGVTDAVPFVVVVVALVFMGDALPSRGAVESDELPDVPRPRNRPVMVAGAAAVGAAALILTEGSYRFGVVTSMIFALIALSLVVLTGLVGQISLAQAGFAGAAGFALSKIGTAVPFPISTLLAGLVAMVLGILVGLPALRIRGAQLAVVTLAGAVAIERFVFRNSYFSPPSGNPIEDPELLGLDLSVRSADDLTRLPFGFLVLAVLVVAAVVVGNLARSDTGRAFLAVRSNERAAAAAGINVASTKLLAFAISSFLAGIGGALIGYSRGQLSADSFGTFVGVNLLAFAYLGGITSVSGALVAGSFAPLGVSYVFLDRNIHLGRYYLLISGVALIVTAIFNPRGIAGQMRGLRSQLSRRWQSRRRPRADACASPSDARAMTTLAKVGSRDS